MTHNTTIAQTHTTSRGGGIDLYTATCSCGWSTGPAREDAVEHRIKEHTEGR